jgi:predicted nucleic acid-binding protein
VVSFFLDASALPKRYAPEPGSGLVDFLFDNVAESRLFILNVGYAEVVSVLVRRRNAGTLSANRFGQALLDLDREIVQSAGKHLLPVDNAIVTDAVALLAVHSINATDAIGLRVALDIAQRLRAAGDDLVLVASDQRLLRAAQAEGLVTFDPETQDQTALAALAGP